MEFVRLVYFVCIGYILTLDACLCHSVVQRHGGSGILVKVNPDKPALGNSMTVTCKRSSLSSAAIAWAVDSSFLTKCDGLKNDICLPLPSGYTFRTDVSANEFNLTIAMVTITDCKTYECKAYTATKSERISKKIQLAYYNKGDISPTEPGAHTDGLISITTGCFLSPDDLAIKWSKIVNGNSVDWSADDPSPVVATDRSTCTRTCHTEEDKKVTSGFTHTEYKGEDSETVQYMVNVSHSSYQDNADIYTWTSANYTKKKATTTSRMMIKSDEKVINMSTTTTTTTTTTPATTTTTTTTTTPAPTSEEDCFSCLIHCSNRYHRIIWILIVLVGLLVIYINVAKSLSIIESWSVISATLECYKLELYLRTAGNGTFSNKPILIHTKGDTVTLTCRLPENIKEPVWEGPSSFTYPDYSFVFINPKELAFGRLKFASNNRDLVLSNADSSDSGVYRCSKEDLNHIVTLIVTSKRNIRAFLKLLTQESTLPQDEEDTLPDSESKFRAFLKLITPKPTLPQVESDTLQDSGSEPSIQQPLKESQPGKKVTHRNKRDTDTSSSPSADTGDEDSEDKKNQ